MKTLEKHKLHRIRSLQELSYVKYMLEYDVTMKEKAFVTSLKGIRYTLVESARQSVMEYGKKLIQMALITIFNKVRNSRKEESETEE
ncbi:hypothetical protein ACE01N_14890 [Saccharicrinis sp. FJH2]|uniref:hypothetical protein n=1 Tax=unclassified Saccharicrinis TaxID=2646859 RepID=UPI0035D4CE43